MRRPRPARAPVDRRDILRRPATPWDHAFLEEAHVAALGPIALVGYGWTAERLRRQFHREIDPANCSVISAEGTRAGYLSILDRGSHWYIDAIAIVPKYQGRGVGGVVMRELLDEARRVRLNVLHVNRARSLYRRLGFRVIASDAQRELMEWP